MGTGKYTRSAWLEKLKKLAPAASFTRKDEGYGQLVRAGLVREEELNKILNVQDDERYRRWLNSSDSDKLHVHYTYFNWNASGPRMGYLEDLTPMCALCNKAAEILESKPDLIVVQWNFGMIGFKDQRGSPQDMLIYIIEKMSNQYEEIGNDYLMDLLDEAERKKFSIKSVKQLFNGCLRELPKNKTLVLLIEGATGWDQNEKFKGPASDIMNYLVNHVVAGEATDAKIKLLVASSPAPSWHGLFDQNDTVGIEGPTSAKEILGEAAKDYLEWYDS